MLQGTPNGPISPKRSHFSDHQFDVRGGKKNLKKKYPKYQVRRKMYLALRYVVFGSTGQL